jgi:D-serine deaminase-like pyridoxal phosphate-dependent protein
MGLARDTEWQHGEGNELVTPALAMNLAAFEHNLAAAENLLRGTGKLLRPHVKTHRTSGLATRQMGPVASGVTCATVQEAEVMAAAGIKDLLLANEIVTSQKIQRMASLAKQSRVIMAVDAHGGVAALSQAANRGGVTVEVLVDMDIGLGRCGVGDASRARELAIAIGRAPALRFAGLMGYEGRIRASVADRSARIARSFTLLAEAKAAMEAAGLEVGIVSAAGTSTLLEALRDPTITEIQAGTYALMEPDLEGLGLPFRCALFVIATVISRSAGRVVLDAGRRTVGCDYGLPIALDPRAHTKSIGDEHVVLEWNGDSPPLGTQVRLRPSQNRTTFNLYSHVWLMRDDHIVARLPIEARGGSQ